MYRVDPDARRELTERLGPGVDRIEASQVPEGIDIDAGEPFVEALWETWLNVTVTLIAYGFTQRSLCDAAAEMAAAKDQAGGRLVLH